jgi:hypothetical protein
MESGFPAKLKAREDTPYEFAIDGNTDAKYVLNDGVDLQCKLSWTAVTVEMDWQGISKDHIPLLNYYDQEGTNVTMIPMTVDNTVNKYFIENNFGVTTDVQITLNWSASIIYTLFSAFNGYVTIRMLKYDNTGACVTYYDLWVSPTMLTVLGANISVTNITATIPLESGHYLILGHMLGTSAGSSGSTHTKYDFITGNMNVEMSAYFVNRYESTYHPTLKAVTVMEYLINEIGKNSLGQPDQTPAFIDHTIESQFPNQIVITSGDAIRNLGGSKLKISFSDLFKFLNTKFGVAFYYDKTTNTCHLQDKTNVFVNSQGAGYGNIGSVNNLKITPFTSEAFVNLKIGDKKQSYDQRGANDTEITNGKDEFNTETSRLSPLVRINSAADYISPIRCDMYGIEFVRVNLESKTLADSSTDNDVFAIHKNEDSTANFDRYVSGTGLVSTPYYLLYRTPIVAGTWEIQNIFSPETAYNILFSPQRSLFRNGAYFRSLLKLNDSDSLNFQLSGMNNVGNLKMITYTNGALDFNEGGAVLISDLCPDEDVLFQPVIFEFETKEVINLYNLIEDNPYSYVTFTYLDNQYAGFIISAKSKPVIRGTTQFKLLAARHTNLTNLIR